MSGWVGSPSPEKLCFAVEIAGTSGTFREYVHAERVRAKDGALVFTNGDMFTSATVAIYSPRRYDSTYLITDADDVPKCIHLKQDDD